MAIVKFTQEEKVFAVCKDIEKTVKNFIISNGLSLFVKPSESLRKYLYIGKVDMSRQEISFTNSEYNSRSIFIYNQEGKIKISVGNIQGLHSARIDQEDIFNLLDIEIVGHEMSGKVFGKTEVKSKIVGKTFKAGTYEVKYGNSKKLDQETYYIGVPTVEQNEEGENITKYIKFVVSDIIFKVPSLKGYSIPKDRTISKGDFVNLIYDKYSSPWTVIEVIPDSTSKKVCKNSSNRKKDIVTIRRNGMEKKVFVKYLKKV